VNDFVTILTALDRGAIATKRHTWNPATQGWLSQPYSAKKHFSHESVPVASVDDLGAIIEGSRKSELKLIIRGELKPGIDGNRVQRKYLGNTAAFLDVPWRWLMADIDGWEIPEGLDHIEDIDVIIERAIAAILPEPFHDCRAFWQLSSSFGLRAGTGLRIHLWFWLDRAIETKLLHPWIVVHAPEIDEKLINPVQIHYCADPIFVGAPDPIFRRTGWVQGERDFVTIPEIDITQLREHLRTKSIANAASSGLSPTQQTSVAGILSEMGDGDGLRKFSKPLVDAGWAYARATPPWQRDIEGLKAVMREAIQAAPKSPQRGSDIERYMSDAWLDEQINGAFAKNPKVAGWEPCTPEHQLPTQDREAARLSLAAIIDKAFADPMRQPTPWALQFSPDLKPTPRQMLVTSEVAIGKTDLALKAIAKFIAEAKAEGRPLNRVIYSVSEHILGSGVLARARAHGINASTWRSRGYKDEVMCLDKEAVELTEKVGGNVGKQVCGSIKDAPENRCVHYATCPFQIQQATVGYTDLVIVAHALMFARLPREVSKNVGFVVFDESFWQQGLDTTSITTATFGQDLKDSPCYDYEEDEDGTKRQVVQRTWTSELRFLRTKAKLALGEAADGYLELKHFVGVGCDDGITKEDCTKAIKLEYTRKRDVHMAPRMPKADRQRAHDDVVINKQIGRMVGFWRSLREALDDGAEVTGRIELGIEEKAGGSHRVAYANYRRPLSKKILATPILMLDGTGSLDIVRHFFPQTELLAADRPVSPFVTTHQIIGGLSKTRLRRYPERVHEVVDFVRLKAGGAKALVICHAEHEEKFEGIPNLIAAHHGAIAGRDDLKDVDHVFVLGSPQANPEATRTMAVQLTGRPIPLEDPVRALRGVLMADGSGIEIEITRFNNPDLEMIRAAITDAAAIQAVGRGRGLNREAGNPLTVWVMADVIVPWPVSDISRWNDVALNPVERMAARKAALMGATDAAKAYPDLFPNREAASKAIFRAVPGGHFRDIPLYVSPHKEMSRKSMSEVSYRPYGRGQNQRTAYVFEHHAGTLEAWLIATIAPLAHYEIVDQPASSSAPDEGYAPSLAYPVMNTDSPLQIVTDLFRMSYRKRPANDFGRNFPRGDPNLGTRLPANSNGADRAENAI
jgi:hypothetical protein